MKLTIVRLLALALVMSLLRTAVDTKSRVGAPGHRKLNSDHGEHDGLDEEDHEGGSIEFENNDELEKTRNYKKVSEDLAAYEEEYSTCIREIPDEEYTQDKVDECVGRNFIKVVLDIKYVTLKVMAKLDTKVRKLFIHTCYAKAGTIEEFSEGCDVMERDVIDMLWNGLEFVDLVEINKEKYLFEYGKIPNEVYRELFAELQVVSKEFFELLDEIDSHKEVSILRLKTLIDDRTKLVKEKEENDESFVTPSASAVHHTIEITETLKTPEEEDVTRKLREKSAAAKMAAQPAAKQPHAAAKPDSGVRKLNVDEQIQRNNLFRKQMVNKLNDAMVKQAQMPFKNIHTAHYSKPKN